MVGEDSIGEFVDNVLLGRTRVNSGDSDGLTNTYNEASYKPPNFKTRESLRRYLHYRNAYRFRRLQKDFAWAKQELERIPKCNPEDARFLL